MKRLLLISAAAGFLLGCNKEPVEDRTPERSLREVTFHTVLPKTDLDGKSPVWVKGDSVKILWTEPTEDSGPAITCATTAPVDPLTGDITATVGNPEDFFYAVYPPQAECLISDDGSMTVTIPSECDGTWGGAQYAAARCPADKTSFEFRNISNVFAFSIEDKRAVTAYIIQREGSNICGSEKFSLDGDGIPGETTEVSSGSGRIKASLNGSGTYYIPVTYGTDWGSCLIMLTDAEDNPIYFNLKEVPFTKRSSVFNLGALDEALYTKDIFITPSGTGNGCSWKNAGGVELLRFLIDNETGGRILDGRTVRLSEGTYNLYDPSCPNGICTIKYSRAFRGTFEGGYPADAEGTSLEGRDPEKHETLFTTENPSLSHSRILYANGGKFNFTFDGIIFTPEKNSGYRGSAVYVNASCAGTLEFEGCTFRSAITRTHASCCQFASMKVRLKDCIVKGNSFTYDISQDLSSGKRSGYGGTFEVSDNADVLFENCIFSGNTGTLCGSCVHCKGGKLTLKGCTLEGNSTTCTAAFTGDFDSCPGGAVSISSYGNPKPAPTVYIDSCTFRNNYSSSCGADIYIAGASAGTHPELYVNRSSFTGASINVGGNTKSDPIKYFQGKSLNSDSAVKDAEPSIYFHNCVLGQTTARNYSNLPTVEAISTNATFVSCSAVDEGVAVFRNDKRYTTSGYSLRWNFLNNAVSNVSNSANAINLAAATTDTCCHFNIMSYCKNAYSISYNTSTKKAASVGKPRFPDDAFVTWEDMQWQYDREGNFYTFDIKPGKENDSERPVRYASSDFIESMVKAVAPSLDEWLKTIHPSSYTIDKRGSARNGKKLQHGSWDPYLQ